MNLMPAHFKNDTERKDALQLTRKMIVLILAIVFGMIAWCIYQLFFK